MYNDYLKYLDNLNYDNLSEINFKSNCCYNGILEHVSYEFGLKYLNLIQNDFNIPPIQIVEFTNINDKYGFPNKQSYNYNGTSIYCSPSSLRYIYHSLVILEHYKKTECKNIVEVGCGYGGLCLAINYFSKGVNIHISDYNIIDFPVVTKLISKYLEMNKEHVHTKIITHSSETYGILVNSSDLFFISNYCYTEIDKNLNYNYSQILLPKTSHGFIIWQNGMNGGIYSICNASEITGKKIVNISEERPQTASGHGIHINYFVYF